MARLVIADTDVVIDFFTDTPPRAQAAAELLKEGRLGVAAVTVFELYAGVRGARRLKQLESFFAHVPVLPLDMLAAAHAGRVYTELKAEGVTVGNQDILIAAICLANGLPLLTGNTSHFASIRGLTLLP
ncbi:MAG TPA: type II toxin-antitoxin system VapC family toxin [Candidatus Aminicenantes bacterium]|nr:type II toxin-antitoxin system VapC family toxin [Candidatus Aminicenantes bacterium]HRY66171.1 type II toxin-antitoxin system VapC family toxin [Candidatus Aminicenantes bacterium]HRZ73085.1 type II toxin-antitoxin system VapC family toxin [Candidatus Aminicenantes bacterium]